MQVSMYVYIHACMYACVDVYLYVCMHACFYACTYVHGAVCIYVCLSVCTSVCGWLAGWLAGCLAGCLDGQLEGLINLYTVQCKERFTGLSYKHILYTKLHKHYARLNRSRSISKYTGVHSHPRKGCQNNSSYSKYLYAKTTSSQI